MKNATEVLTSRHFEQDAIHHRLSWFATLQGLLFLSFALIDKDETLLISALVCVGVAMCVPAIASTYAQSRLKNWIRLALAVFWVALGAAQFLLHPA